MSAGTGPAESESRAPMVEVRAALPVYDEGPAARKAVEELLERLPRIASAYRVWVYDDGSTDGLGGLDDVAARIPALSIHRRPVNGGVGEFFRWCLTEPIRDARDDDVLAILEGDATSDVEVLGDLVRAIDSGADVAVGSRYVPGGRISGFPLGKALTSRVTNGLLRVLYRGAVRDWTIFYRAYRVSALRRLAASLPRGLASGGFTTNAEILVRLVRLGCRVVEVPQHYRYGAKTGASKLKVLPHTTELMRLVRALPPWP